MNNMINHFIEQCKNFSVHSCTVVAGQCFGVRLLVLALVSFSFFLNDTQLCGSNPLQTV